MRAFASRGQVTGHLAAMRHALMPGRALLTRLPSIAAATVLAANFSVVAFPFLFSFIHPLTSTIA